MSALALALMLTLSAETEVLSGTPSSAAKAPEHPVPAFLPRGVSLGLSFNAPLWSLQARLQWEVGLYERRGHDLVATVVLGTGLAMALPPGMTAHYQHVGLLGFGYRKVSKLINWGFHWGVGANWYRAAFTARAFESRVVPYTEGRAQLGVRVLPHLVLGAYFGYGSPFEFNTRFPGLTYTGGIMFGLFADWR